MGYQALLSDKEQVMKDMVTAVIHEDVSVAKAAIRFGVSEKTVRRKVDAYLREGMGSLVHRGRGRRAHNRTDADIELTILELYRDKYTGYNFTHFHQKLVEVEGIEVSYPVVYYLLSKNGYRSPRAQRKHRDFVLHPCRARRDAFGEMVQMDASVHPWFDDFVCNLHLAIDDASSTILGGHFEEQETLHGYFMLFAQVVTSYGVPEELYTDKRTVFHSRSTACSRLEDDTSTQFRMAAAKLGVIDIHTTSVPQAKGRVERAFQTFQDRLISEMRTAGVLTIEQANDFLPAFIADHNARYACDISKLANAFVSGPGRDELGMALSVVSERTVTAGSYVSYKCKTYLPFDDGKRVLLKAGTKVLVLKSLDDMLYLVRGNDIWPLFCFETKMLPRSDDLKGRIYIPPKDHPWKEESYKIMLATLRRAG